MSGTANTLRALIYCLLLATTIARPAPAQELERQDVSDTPLLRAASHKDVKAVRALLQDHTPGVDPLIVAIRMKSVEMVRLLLADNADPNTRIDADPELTKSVAETIQERKGGVARILLQDTDVQKQFPNQTEIIGAVSLRSLNIARILLSRLEFEEGSQAAARGRIMSLVRRNSKAILRMLLNKGLNALDAYPFGDGATALMAATDTGSIEIVRLLIAKKADVNARTEFDSALTIAVKRSSPEIVSLLLEHGADVNVKITHPSSRTTMTPLLIALDSGHPEIAEIMIHGKLAIDDRDSGLCKAARAGNLSMCKLLLDHGAKPNGRCRDHLAEYETVIENAVASGSTELCRLLLTLQADVTANASHALAVAVENGHNDIAALLLNSGAAGNAHYAARDVLHGAVFVTVAVSGDLPLCRLFLAHGADGAGELIMAEKHGDRQLVAILRNAGVK